MECFWNVLRAYIRGDVRLAVDRFKRGCRTAASLVEAIVAFRAFDDIAVSFSFNHSNNRSAEQIDFRNENWRPDRGYEYSRAGSLWSGGTEARCSETRTGDYPSRLIVVRPFAETTSKKVTRTQTR